MDLQYVKQKRLPVFSFQFLKNRKNYRTGFAVFMREFKYLIKAFAVGVRIVLAGSGSVSVNHAVIVGH